METPPLYRAAYHGEIDEVRLLFEQRADVNEARNYRGTALHSASQCGHCEVVRYLCAHRANVGSERKGRDRVTPFHLAVSAGASGVARILIEYKANINGCIEVPDISECCDAHRVTPMALAVQRGYGEVVRVLYDYRADVCKESAGETPLDLALELGHLKIAKALKPSVCLHQAEVVAAVGVILYTDRVSHAYKTA
jgi:ankyrin repeat protein